MCNRRDGLTLDLRLGDDEIVDAHFVALCLGGWSVARLRVWRFRHPDLLPVAKLGRRGVALFRWGDVRHAAATVFEQEATRR